MKKVFSVLSILLIWVIFSQAQFRVVPTVTLKTVFIGFPKTGMAFNGMKDGKLMHLLPKNANKLDCVITKRGDKYFWTSRDNHEVEKVRQWCFHYI